LREKRVAVAVAITSHPGRVRQSHPDGDETGAVTEPLSSSPADHAPPRGPASAETLLRAWWVPLLTGVLNLIAALVVLIEPHNSLKAIAVVLGIYLVIGGIMLGVAGLVRADGTRGWWAFALGALAVIAGIFVILRPGSAVHGVRIVFGIYLLLAGGAHLGIAAIAVGNRTGEVLRGALDLIGGLVFLFAPKLGLAALALFVGIYLLIRGVLDITLAVELRRGLHDARH
jgi:uncharacterized membrane protein HdeD (DUF308 family)